MKATISISKGKGSTAHNDRTIKKMKNCSWRADLSNRNLIKKNEPIKIAYQHLFEKSLIKYNASQIEKGHSERVIKNYYDKISRSKQEKPFYELIFEIGNSNDFAVNSEESEKFKEILSVFADDFQKRNPNFYVFQSIIHDDEPNSLPHLHVDFIPFSNNNKRGLETKTSLSGALSAMNFSRNGFGDWRKKEQDVLIKLMSERNIEFKLGDGRTTHLSCEKYKNFTQNQELKDEIKELKDEIKEKDTLIIRLKTIISDLESKLSVYIGNTLEQAKSCENALKISFKSKLNNAKSKADNYNKNNPLKTKKNFLER